MADSTHKAAMRTNQRRAKRPVYSVEHVRGRWMLRGPDGAPFISLGIAHLAAAAAYRAADGPEDRVRFVEQVVANLREWRFNTAGYHHPAEIRERLPFIADTFLALIPYSVAQPRYPDVFGGYARVVGHQIHRMCAVVKSNPNLIGYYWTDTPRWDLDTARRLANDDWVSAIRRNPAVFPGKRRYVAFLCERHRAGAEAFRAAYGLNLDERTLLDANFAGLALDHPLVHRDDYEFLRLIAREYYRAAGEAMEREDRRHLVFGDRYMLNDLPVEVLEEALPWIDVVAVQPQHARFEKERFDRIYRIARKPILICDHAIGFPSEKYPRTGWEQCASETDAAHAYERNLADAFAEPYIVGYHRCHYADRFAAARGRLMQGLLSENGSPHEKTIESTRRANGATLEKLGVAAP
ncbi:MAG: hypothetical protein ACLQAT_19265 [Candidatus Binataceae bacterium]